MNNVCFVFDDIKTDARKFHDHKNLVLIDDVDVDKILILIIFFLVKIFFSF